jgi:hypothetical protein
MKHKAFRMLMVSIHREFSTEAYSKNARITVLTALSRLRIADPEILRQTEQLIMQKDFSTKHLTQVLTYFARFKYQKGPYLEVAIE